MGTRKLFKLFSTDEEDEPCIFELNLYDRLLEIEQQEKKRREDEKRKQASTEETPVLSNPESNIKNNTPGQSLWEDEECPFTQPSSIDHESKNEEIPDQFPIIFQPNPEKSIFNHTLLRDIFSITDLNKDKNDEETENDLNIKREIGSPKCRYDLNYPIPDIRTQMVDEEKESESKNDHETTHTSNDDDGDDVSSLSSWMSTSSDENIEEKEVIASRKRRLEAYNEFKKSLEEYNLSAFLEDLLVEDDIQKEIRYKQITEIDRDQHKIVVLGNREKEWFELDNARYTSRILSCLGWTNWLNDEVINGYMKLLQCRDSQLRKLNIYPKCHFFKSYFLGKLYLDASSYNYRAVRKWTMANRLQNWGQESPSVIDCDILFFPVHLGDHWVMAAAFLKYKKIRYYDSLRGERKDVTASILRYIVDESMDKLNRKVNEEEWIVEFPKEIPVQLNGSDCGIFALQFAKYLSVNKKLTFSQGHMCDMRIKVMSELMNKNIEC